jgi:hypothetical protein
VYGPDALCYKFYLLLQLEDIENNDCKTLQKKERKNYLRIAGKRETKSSCVIGDCPVGIFVLSTPSTAAFLEENNILTNLDMTLKLSPRRE